MFLKYVSPEKNDKSHQTAFWACAFHMQETFIAEVKMFPFEIDVDASSIESTLLFDYICYDNIGTVRIAFLTTVSVSTVIVKES